MERVFLIIAVVVLALAGSALMLAQGPDPFVGTWKLNLAKSKYTGAAAPKSDTLTFEAQGNGLRLTRDGIAADGSRIAYSFATSLDGKPVPVSGSGTPAGADMEAVKRINSNTTTATYTKAGTVVDNPKRSFKGWEGHDHYGKSDERQRPAGQHCGRLRKAITVSAE
jgi:hypothetical protein